jgi:uncharacterized LabA/DUF88 family protein
MTKNEITKFISSFEEKRERTIVIVDFGNVVKWDRSLRWRVGIKELGQLTRQFSTGSKFLRRFYYGADYGPSESSVVMSDWSQNVYQRAGISGFEPIFKRVKYIHDSGMAGGFEKKCDFDVEMAIDLVKEAELYNNIVLFSGDGDLMYALRYLKAEYGKACVVFGARDHLGREVFDAQRDGIVDQILYADDFEYRLNMDRFH